MENTPANHLNAMSDHIKQSAESRGLCVLACTIDDPDDTPYGPYLDSPVDQVPVLAQSLGLPAILVTRVLLDANMFSSETAGEHDGECSHLYVGISYDGQRYWARHVAEWFRAVDDEDDDDADVGVDQPSLLVRGTDWNRLVDFAAAHPALKNQSATVRTELERHVRSNVAAVAAEIDIEIPDHDVDSHRLIVLVRDISMRIAEAQRAACNAVDDELDTWAARLLEHPDFAKPIATQREQLSKKMLTEHLGFTPPRGLYDRLRKHADGIRKTEAASLF